MATRREWKKAQRGRNLVKRKKRFLALGEAVVLLLMIGIFGFFAIKKNSTSSVSKTEEIVTVTKPADELEPKEELVQVQMNAIEPVVFLAEHTITHSSSSNRDTNLAVCAKIINGKTDGYILFPDEKFSYRKVIGNPDTKRGFKPAGEIQNGKPSTGIGGGVCQVMSTINSAIHKTDLKTDDKHLHAETHRLTITYLNPSRGDKEASVAYSSGKDFWFINTLDYPIRIKVKTKAGNVTVQIFSVPRELSN